MLEKSWTRKKWSNVKAKSTDLDTGGIAHRLWSNVWLTRLSGDHGQPKNLLESISNCPHIHLLIWSHNDVNVPTRLWGWTTQKHLLRTFECFVLFFFNWVKQGNLLMYGAMPGSRVVIMDSTECLVLSKTVFTTAFPATPWGDTIHTE